MFFLLANKEFQSLNALLLQFVQFAVFAVFQEIGSESAKCAKSARCNGSDYFALSHVLKTFPCDFQMMLLGVSRCYWQVCFCFPLSLFWHTKTLLCQLQQLTEIIYHPICISKTFPAAVAVCHSTSHASSTLAHLYIKCSIANDKGFFRFESKNA